MQYLRYNTASQNRQLGPFLDDQNGHDAETGLTINNTDIKLMKHGATSSTNKNSGGATHVINGVYYAAFNASDTDTIGGLRVSIDIAGALPVWEDFIVFPAEVYDYFVAAAGTDYMKVDVKQWNETNVASPATGGVPKVAIEAAGDFIQAAADKVWSTTTRALTDKAGFSISGTKTTLDSLNDITAASVWAVATRALTEKTGFSLAADQSGVTIGTVNTLAAAVIDAIWDELVTGHSTASSFAKLLIDNLNATVGSRSSHSAADVWTVGTRALTDKADFALSSASWDAIWDQAGSLTLSFENIIQRIYQMINNKMTVNETSGNVALRNIGDSADIATGNVGSTSGTTTRLELTWS